MTGRYDCCPGGGHREDALCSRTAVKTLPPAAEPTFEELLARPDLQFDGGELLPHLMSFRPAVEPEPQSETKDDRGGPT